MRKESRRHGRELAMQALFFIDSVHSEILNGDNDENQKNNNYSLLQKQPDEEQQIISSTLIKQGVKKRKVFNIIDRNLLKPDDIKTKEKPKLSNKKITDSNKVLDIFWNNFSDSEKNKDFFYQLTSGVIEKRKQIDDLIEQFSNNWKINRMSCVDRNIMRIAVYELIFCEDIPPKVSINEAVDIGKAFGTDESGPFINGILDSIRISIGK